MKTSEIWNFVKKNMTTVITVIVGVLGVILKRVGLLDSEATISLIFILITLLATSELVHKSYKLDKIEELILDKSDSIVKELKGFKVLKFKTSNEAFEFMSNCILTSQESILHFALAEAVPLANNKNNSFDKAIFKSLKQNKIRYTYIANLPNKRREIRINTILNDPHINTFFVKYIDTNIMAFHNFMVFDNKTAIMNFPYKYGRDESFVFIEQPSVVDFYISYFDHVWDHAKIYNQTI